MIDELIAELAREGERRHGRWNRDVYARWAPHAHALEEKVARAYLEAVREGIAEEMLGVRREARSVLELGLSRAPTELAGQPAKKAIELLATLWNVAEGMRGEPAWINDYVLSRQAELSALDQLVPWLKHILAPVLGDSEVSTFSKTFAVHVLDFRPIMPEFLPGQMTLLAPRVLAVRDRAENLELGVLLRHDQKSEITGELHRSEDAALATTASLPEVKVSGSSVRIGTTEIALPLLVSPHGHSVVPSGFVAISAVDSQRLWIVESR